MTSDKKSPSCSLAVTLSFQASETQPTQRETERKKKRKKKWPMGSLVPPQRAYVQTSTYTHTYIYIHSL